ncbi:hypothetical protein HIM_06020 [Hirsutella minnesotensis 3608]|uniref:Uncharacterized protein n=1 Tax=Hirsutella minnesotensis 3608 TaxID=1043627 RepID=A0A0F7ZP07_9HYPO|nr:hypothetical protein HIM_06020 [Hirsutella minnesotensis 3608]
MASPAVGTMTPSPPPAAIRTPPAPRLGFPDSWEPYTPRKSSRISSQVAANRTPSPRASQTRKQQAASPRTSKKANAQSSAAMVSPVPSPRKKPHPASHSTSRQPSGTLTAEGTANAAAALGLNDTKTSQRAPASSISRATGMLPTPSKTPQKPPNEKTAANIQSFARHLFASDEEAMPSPRKRRPKKYSGVTMESFTAEETSIQIFTDSQDRVPAKDDSVENPFYGDAAIAAPPKRRSKRRLVNVPGEGALSVEDASRREDGMVYVFRGKKFFREFSKGEDSPLDDQDEPRSDVESALDQPLTRSSVKPRLLFPKAKPDQSDEDEAVTDVEDTYMVDKPLDPQTPKKTHSTPAKTPEAPKFAPVSPPDTKRTTRSTNKLALEGTPVKGISDRRSPFDAWPRTKELKAPAASKRSGESLASSAPKRTRA